ncbi:MAG: polysaccharide biosynthesis/export family protein [Alphaproteobacteria bacterium]
MISANAESISEYSLGTGDKVRVIVFDQADLSGEFTIDGKGNIALPLIGNILAGGKTLGQLEQDIVRALKPDYLKDPRVSVDMLEYRPFYIIGEVRNPRSYPYVSGMSVVNAVALAGGYTHRARENRVHVMRASDPKRVKRPADHNTQVFPGDIIEVPERMF